MGAGPGRDPADAAAQRAARPGHRAGRRPAQDRPRRRRSRRCSAPRSSASPPRRWSSSGCIMMRVCHLDTCPVGIATQNPVLRERFTGKPEFVENFFLFLAEEVRGYLAELGFRTIDEAIGHAELLDVRPAVDHWKAGGLDLTPCCTCPTCPTAPPGAGPPSQDHGLEQALDNTAHRSWPRRALRRRHAGPARGRRCATSNRTVGAMLGGEVTRRFGGDGLPDDTIDVTLRGTAGQSFGAFVPRGVTLRLHRRRQRLRRQGPVRRPARRAPDARGAVRRRGATSSPATRSCTARPAASCSCAAGSASGSPSATPARSPSSRASATTAAST